MPPFFHACFVGSPCGFPQIVTQKGGGHWARGQFLRIKRSILTYMAAMTACGEGTSVSLFAPLGPMGPKRRLGSKERGPSLPNVHVRVL